jgi:hypothetical protein
LSDYIVPRDSYTRYRRRASFSCPSHQVAYTTVEAIGGLAWEVTFRDSSAAAVPALVRLLKAGMGMSGDRIGGSGGGMSAGAKVKERKQCWVGPDGWFLPHHRIPFDSQIEEWTHV